ncbi:MAG: RHS repeat-associated core domain-containing protein [Bacteroidales bacterium]|nr:RHS repeat-associated core domain-containing protein [Bacteroidales bacterium]
MKHRRITSGEIFYFGNNEIPKYSFNAKELDEETGMYYYEARYYAPPVFTSRDPLFEKYPTFSPYIYCYNNPLRFIDPTGLYGYENIEEGQSYKVVAVFNSKYQDTKALWKEISEWRKAGCDQIANELQADYDAITSARQAGMPMMFVDNMEDYANAMNDFSAMGSSTDIYTLNSHGGNGEFNIGETKIDKYTNFSTLKNGLSDKTVFINACNVTWGKEGQDLIRHFSQQTSSTVIGKNSEISSSYWYNGGIGLNLSGNRFQMSTNGSDATEIRNVRINQNKGIIWKGSGGYH